MTWRRCKAGPGEGGGDEIRRERREAEREGGREGGKSNRKVEMDGGNARPHTHTENRGDQ